MDVRPVEKIELDAIIKLLNREKTIEGLAEMKIAINDNPGQTVTNIRDPGLNIAISKIKEFTGEIDIEHCKISEHAVINITILTGYLNETLSNALNDDEKELIKKINQFKEATSSAYEKNPSDIDALIEKEKALYKKPFVNNEVFVNDLEERKLLIKKIDEMQSEKYMENKIGKTKEKIIKQETNTRKAIGDHVNSRKPYDTKARRVSDPNPTVDTREDPAEKKASSSPALGRNSVFEDGKKKNILSAAKEKIKRTFGPRKL